MKHTLVGYTGFVGGNLAAGHRFDNLYNSKNITEGFGAPNGLVVYSGMPSEKFVAAADPAADLATAAQAMDNIEKLAPERLVLISTVDVYPHAAGVNENTRQDTQGAGAYGANRLQLENWVRQKYPQALILRLPGLFGKGIKKNFIYDMMTITPAALTEEKYAALSAQNPLVASSYAKGSGGFYRLVPMEEKQKKELKNFYEQNGFNALCFTDSRSNFQFYNLARLWADIEKALDAGLTLVNLAVQPLNAAFLYEKVFAKPFCNELQKPPANYDMRTIHADILGGQGGYLAGSETVADEIVRFVRQGI